MMESPKQVKRTGGNKCIKLQINIDIHYNV